MLLNEFFTENYKIVKNTLFKLTKHLTISLATVKPHLLTKIFVCTRTYTKTATATRFLITCPTL